MAQDQIRQMVNFILQEAHEKANEIRVKVRSSCYIIIEPLHHMSIVLKHSYNHNVFRPNMISTWKNKH